MRVKQLKELLSDMPDDALVVLSQDSEGNGFSPVGSYNKSMNYIPGRCPWQRGQAYQADDIEFGNDNALPAIVLWPMH
jgi:hypothetical protein